MAPYDFRLLPLLPEIHNSCTWTHISEEQTLKKKFKFSFKFLLKVGVNPSPSDIPPSLEFPANGYTSKFTLEITLQLATYQSCQTLLNPPPLLPIYPSLPLLAIRKQTPAGKISKAECFAKKPWM